MKSIVVLALLAAAAGPGFAQGTPSPQGQAITPEGASSAEAAVERKHEKRVAKKAAKKAKAASAASQ